MTNLALAFELIGQVAALHAHCVQLDQWLQTCTCGANNGMDTSKSGLPVRYLVLDSQPGHYPHGPVYQKIDEAHRAWPIHRIAELRTYAVHAARVHEPKPVEKVDAHVAQSQREGQEY